MRYFLVFLLFAVCTVCSGRTIEAISGEGYDTIYLDDPAFISEFHYNADTDRFYAYGDATFRQINHRQGVFAAVDNVTVNSFDHPFIDVKLFSSSESNHDLWAIGPTYTWPKGALSVGYFLPISVLGPNQWSTSFQGHHRGYTFYAVSLDHRNFAQSLAYFVGWAQGPIHGGANDSVNLVVVRAHIDFTKPTLGFNITWTHEDILILSVDNFHPYHVTFKPRLIHDYTNNKLFIIEPSQHIIYKAYVPEDGVSPLSLENKLDVSGHGSLAGSTWHYYQETLYVGFAGNGELNGTLLAIDLVKLQVLRSHVFPAFYSNPRAIAGQNRTIYIGFEGGPAILSFDTVNWRISGYARLPPHLHTVYTAWDSGFDHVYFATHEQHSKVFRISKENFCHSECPYNGFCSRMSCECIDGYELSKGACEVKSRSIINTITEEGAAIAMGILFAITVIAAAAGWYMYYRSKQGYQRVL